MRSSSYAVAAIRQVLQLGEPSIPMLRAIGFDAGARAAPFATTIARRPTSKRTHTHGSNPTFSKNSRQEVLRFESLETLIALVAVEIDLHAQELSFLGRNDHRSGFQELKLCVAPCLRAVFYAILETPVAYINEGHLHDHYRDRTAWLA